MAAILFRPQWVKAACRVTLWHLHGRNDITRQMNYTAILYASIRLPKTRQEILLDSTMEAISKTDLNLQTARYCFFKMQWYFLIVFPITVMFIYEIGPIQWIFSQHCGYWWPDTLTPVHQHLQWWVCKYTFALVYGLNVLTLAVLY